MRFLSNLSVDLAHIFSLVVVFHGEVHDGRRFLLFLTENLLLILEVQKHAPPIDLSYIITTLLEGG